MLEIQPKVRIGTDYEACWRFLRLYFFRSEVLGTSESDGSFTYNNDNIFSY